MKFNKVDCIEVELALIQCEFVVTFEECKILMVIKYIQPALKS